MQTELTQYQTQLALTKEKSLRHVVISDLPEHQCQGTIFQMICFLSSDVLRLRRFELISVQRQRVAPEVSDALWFLTGEALDSSSFVY